MTRLVPTIATEVPGNYLAGALWNANVKAMGDFLMGSSGNGAPRFRGNQTTAQAMSNDTWTALTIDTEVFDSDNGHSTTTNTSRYVVQVAGTYLLFGSAGFAANGTGNRGIRLLQNGAAIAGSFVKTTPATTSGSTGLITLATVLCVVGDYLEVQGNQNSGAALNTNNGSDVGCSLAASWLTG